MSTLGVTHVLEGHGHGRPPLPTGVPRTTPAQRSPPSAHIWRWVGVVVRERIRLLLSVGGFAVARVGDDVDEAELAMMF